MNRRTALAFDVSVCTGLHPGHDHRRVAGTFTCTCGKYGLYASPTGLRCGHCDQAIHSWTDGDLIGLALTCTDGTLTVRLVDFEIDLHRCGNPDALTAGLEDELAQMTLQEVPA